MNVNVLRAPADAVRRAFLDDTRAEDFVRSLLARAGVTVGGSAPHDLVVHDPRFYARVLRDGSLGLGESYVDGWWDAPALDVLMTRVLSARLDREVRESWTMVSHVVRSRMLNLQSVVRAFEVGRHHYDLGNDLYEAMLDRRMVYTCGFWQDAASLEEAQRAKLELVCRKIGLRRGMRVLDLGCGWGGFARYAAEEHGAQVSGITVSTEQASLARARCAGLPVTIQLTDYREAAGSYDAVVSIGLMEHVGHKNYGTYMDVVERCLAPGGVAFIHTIAGNASRSAIEPWFERYVFPNASLPSITQLTAVMEERFALEDVHNIGPHYDPTLMAWHRNFEAAWPSLAPTYGERFRRMWTYYLLTSAAGFRARYCQLYQIVMTRVGTPQPASCRS